MRIVVGGQLDKENIKNQIINLAGNGVEITVKSDIEAAMAIKANQADYYIGACNTGGGGALALAIAMIGAPKCVTLSMPGNIKSDEQIAQEVASGKVAFGFTAEHANRVLPALIKALLEKGSK